MKNSIYIVLIFAGLLTYSCNDDFLNKHPETSISPDEFFKTEGDLKLYVDGLLSLKDKYAYQGDQGTDNLATTAAVEIRNVLTGSPSSESLSSGWSWDRLRDINYFLDHADLAEIEQKDLKHYLGLVRMYRAIFYYDMVKRYSDVPWYGSTLELDDEEALYKPRDSRAMVVDSIMADLAFAYENVRENVSTGTPGKWVAATEYARIALNEGSWRKYHSELELQSSAERFFSTASEVAKDIMESGLFAIYNTGNPEEDYRTLFTSLDLTGNPEVILPHVYDDEIGHGLEVYTIFDDYEQSPSRELIQTFLMRDGSRFTDIPGYEKKTYVEEFENRDFRLQGSYAYPGWHHREEDHPYIQRLNKNFSGYHQIKGYDNHRDNEINRTIDMPAYRYAEVLLIYAEAMVERGEIDQSVVDQTINVLRDRAGVAPLDIGWANANPDPFLIERYPGIEGENAGVLLEIRRERRIELAFEGFRYEDLMRWKAARLLLNAPTGMYFPGLGQYDMTGDGVVNIELISKDRDIPFEEEKDTNALGEKLIYYRVSTIDDASGTVYLENGEEGGVIMTENTDREFIEPQYYYRPIPETQMVLNPNLEQIFGW